jgi:hypothetical protein
MGEALSWLADDHPIELETDLHHLLRAVVLHGKGYVDQTGALRRLARLVAASDLDSATVLFDHEAILPASRFRQTLDRLASRCSGGTLGGITADAVIAAQRDDPFTLEALSFVAGLAYKELTERVSDLPGNAAGPFGPSQLRRAFEALDAIIEDRLTTDLPGAVPARPIELMPRVGLGKGGWEAVDALRVGGVPYELLLSQRAAGGAWLAHRNKTSTRLAPLLVDRLCSELQTRGLDFRRSTGLRGDTPPNTIRQLSGCDKQLGFVVLNPARRAAFGVIFSSARDSGTASKNAGRLRGMKRPHDLPIAVVVAGPGWSARNETAELAADFGGWLYSENSLPALADEILRTVRSPLKELR